MALTATLRCWLRFNAVGVAGAIVQLGALWLLVEAGLPKPLAAAIAVEAAVIHNFLWHERWTWPHFHGRPGRLRRFARFNTSNGAISIAGNAFFMWLLATKLGWPYMAVNVLSVIICSLFNFAASDRLVYYSPAVSASPHTFARVRLRLDPQRLPLNVITIEKAEKPGEN